MRSLLIIIASLIMVFVTKAQPYKYSVDFIDLNDSIKVAYVDEGPKEAPVILMVHGLGGYIKNWYPIIDQMSGSYRCIALDLPGYGASSIVKIPGKLSMNLFADAVDQLAKQLGLSKVNLLGHSMGGQISIILALQKPVWLEKLILAAPAGFETFNAQEEQALLQFGSAEAFAAQTEAQIRMAYAMNFYEQPAWVEEMIEDRLMAIAEPNFQTYCAVRAAGVEGMLANPVADRLKEIQYPTLVIFGEEDKLIPNTYLHPDLTVQKVAEVGNTIPEVTIKTLPMAGHMLQVDQPAAFSNLIQSFIQP